MYNITIPGDIPSKKNSKRRIQRGTHIFMVPSKAHEEWHKRVMPLLTNWRDYDQIKEPIADTGSVMIIFYPSNLRRADLSNKAESIMDILVDAGILKDDNWFIVSHLMLGFGGVDRENPRAEITITT